MHGEEVFQMSVSAQPLQCFKVDQNDRISRVICSGVGGISDLEVTGGPDIKERLTRWLSKVY